MALTEATIDQLVDLVRSQVEALPPSHRALSLDAKWEILKNAAGFQIGRGRLDLIQVGYCLGDCIYRALLLKATGMKELPQRLCALFE